MSRQAGSLGALVLVLCSPIAAGHAASTSYVSLDAATSEGLASITWDVSAAELHRLIGLDLNDDGRVTWLEIQAQHARFAQLTKRHLKVRRGGRDCSTRLQDVRLVRRAGELHLSLLSRAACTTHGRYELAGTLFFNENALQRTLVDARTSAGAFASMLSPEAVWWREPERPASMHVLGRFIWQGMLHVATGYDHVAFIVLLLLPSVLRASGAGWRPVGRAGEIARPLLVIVTSFTLAHSITLALAATGTVSLPSAPVEAAIALSIIVAGLINLVPSAERLRLPVASGFGLVHGFGFANVFAELGRGGADLLPVLGGFNLGVELAQLAIVAAALPGLLLLRRSPFYAARLMPVASMAIAAVGAVWLAERLG